MTDKVLTLLGFAAKSGSLIYGANAAITALKTNKTHLVVWADDVSPKTRKEIVFFAEKSKIPTLGLSQCDIQCLSNAVGKKCGVIALTDRQFAEAVIKAAKSGGNANEQ